MCIRDRSGDKTVKLNGNIDFNYDAETSGTTTDANVKIKLTNGDSYWTGRALTTDDSVGEVDYPSDDPNFQIGTKAEGLVLELASGGTWNMTGNSFVTTMNMTGGGIVNGSADAKKLSVKDFTVSGTNNVFKLDKDTVFTGTITFTDANAELVTNLNTAYEVSADDFLTVEGSDEKVLNNATGKLTLDAPDGGTLTIDDAITYSSDGLKALRDAYINDANSALELNLSNATLYVAPPAGETGETTMEIPENTIVTLSAKGEQDLSGGADNFTIKGSVNVVADTTEGAVQTQATLNNVSVTGTVSEAASLNLKSVAADAQAITLQNAVLSVGDDGTTPDDEDKVDTQKTTLLTVTKLVADNGARVLVGNKDSIGLIEVDELYSKAGSVIFADPAWNKDSALQTVGNASGLAATAVNGAVEGIVAAGENSFVAFGTDLAGARAMINYATVWGENETGAAIVVAAPITIGGGTIAANPTWKRETDVTASAGKMVVADNAVLVVDQSAAPADGTPLIGGDLSVEGGTVGVINAQEGTLNIAETTSGLTADNLTLDNPFLDAELTNLGFTATVNTDRFALAVTSFGMQSMTRRIDAAMAASVADRTTFGQISDQPLNLWVDVSGERYEVSSNADFNADMGYAVFGADAGLADNVRVGAAVEYATGSLRAAENGAKNDLDAYGLTVYGIWQPCPKGAIVADLGYIKGSNDLTSDAFTVTGSVDTTMMSAGLRAQYKSSLGAFSLIPSVGVRVSRLETDAFAVSGIDVEKQKQTLVQLPVALRIHAGEANAAGWTVAPSFKIAWVPTFGDKEITLRGVDVDVIASDEPLDDYDVVVAPMLYMLRDGAAESLAAFVKRGGQLLSTYFTGYVDKDQLCILGGFPGNGLADVFGIISEEIDTLYPSDRNSVSFTDGSSCELRDYAEILRVGTADVLGTYDSDFYAGNAAVTVNSYGEGKAYYVAARIDYSKLGEIMEQMMVNAGIAIKDLPDGVQYHCRYADDGTAYGFYLNNTNEPQTISEVHGTDIQTKNIFDGKMELAPFGVSIIKENN